MDKDSRKIHSWLCFYGDRADPEVLERFDLIVFDATYHPPLPERKRGRPIVLGYVSVGEVIDKGHLWDRVAGQPYLVRKNEAWDSWVVDVTDGRWQTLLFDTVIPDVVDQGFDGFFLDTFDSVLNLPEAEGSPILERHMAELAGIVRRLKAGWPTHAIAVNRGLPVLARIAGMVDFVAVEGLYSTCSRGAGTCGEVDDYARHLLLDQVRQGQSVNAGLTVLTLDYAGVGQTDLAEAAIAFARRRGFVPYVATPELRQVYMHTVRK